MYIQYLSFLIKFTSQLVQSRFLMLLHLSQLVQSRFLTLFRFIWDPLMATAIIRRQSGMGRIPDHKLHRCWGQLTANTYARDVPPSAIGSIWRCHRYFHVLCSFIRVIILQVVYYFTRDIKSFRRFTHSTRAGLRIIHSPQLKLQVIIIITSPGHLTHFQLA